MSSAGLGNSVMMDSGFIIQKNNINHNAVSAGRIKQEGTNEATRLDFGAIGFGPGGLW
jgi:hypothetical protein